MSEYEHPPYIVVEEHDPDPDIRNAPPQSRQASASRPRRVYRVPMTQQGKVARPQWPTSIGGGSGAIVHVPSQPDPATQVVVVAQDVANQSKRRSIRVEKIADGIVLASDGLAALWPLPDQPPAPTGDEAVDIANQNEHRHAVAARQLATDRLRTVGRVLGGILKLAFADDEISTQ